MNFTATVLSGVLTGCLLQSSDSPQKKVRLLLLAVLVCFLISFALSWIEPIIKRLWTSSMMFLSTGISVLLMLLSYYWIDIKKRGKNWKWLKIYGMNSILAYMLFHTLNTVSLREFWLHGFEHLIGDYYPVLLELAHVSIIFFILLYCYRKRVFLKV